MHALAHTNRCLVDRTTLTEAHDEFVILHLLKIDRFASAYSAGVSDGSLGNI